MIGKRNKGSISRISSRTPVRKILTMTTRELQMTLRNKRKRLLIGMKLCYSSFFRYSLRSSNPISLSLSLYLFFFSLSITTMMIQRIISYLYSIIILFIVILSSFLRGEYNSPYHLLNKVVFIFRGRSLNLFLSLSLKSIYILDKDSTLY
jgi:hypothetical protein